jgi:hypothetical protein
VLSAREKLKEVRARDPKLWGRIKDELPARSLVRGLGEMLS